MKTVLSKNEYFVYSNMQATFYRNRNKCNFILDKWVQLFREGQKYFFNYSPPSPLTVYYPLISGAWGTTSIPTYRKSNVFIWRKAFVGLFLFASAEVDLAVTEAFNHTRTTKYLNVPFYLMEVCIKYYNVFCLCF